ncbi:amidase family protein [Herbiconiux moechotypicola]|uniref:Amidase family protein n=1 Tax=Herbiconiux moechotypicola TaxID=637393 RepID=A0ABN3E373_9MICO|nr:amidase family protein [Herbiconiux moechotypicola]MCS5731575.1 amidase family protein [Herbiconiux moechotypicola]
MSGYRELGVDEYESLSAVQLGRRVATGELSPVQLAECALELARAAEPALNAYAAFMPERALRDAAEREAEARDGRVRGPLHGVPIASKDNIAIAGETLGKGSLTSSDAPQPTSSPFAARLLDAGAVIIGRTTTPEFGWKGTGISPRTGVSRNPWDVTRNTGGSSAGSGATVASGAVPIATGTDAGGSVRIPAAFCGVVGLKPTLGAIPVWPGTVNENLSHAGPLARTVADARAVFELARGADPRDPQSAFSTAVPAEPGRVHRVGVVRAPFGIEPSDEVGRVFDDSLRLLRDSGVAEFVEVELPAELPRRIFESLWVTGRGYGFHELIREHGDIMDPGLARLGALAEEYTLPGFLGALVDRRAFNAAFFALFDDLDLLLTPTMPITAFAADAEVPPGGEADAQLPWITWTPYTYPFNITGQPAITIPTHLRPGALPVGLQLVGPWAHDQRVLDVAERFEAVLAPTHETRVARAAR